MTTVSSAAGQASGRPSDSVDNPVNEVPGRPRARSHWYVVALFLLSLFAWAPLLYPGYLQVHSGFFPVVSVSDLAASSDKLHWLPAFLGDSDLLRGDGPLAYWLALVPRPLTGAMGAVKAIFALSILAGGLGVFAWVRRDLSGSQRGATDSDDVPSTGIFEIAGVSSNLKGRRAALLAAVVYMLWPPLLATVYVRGALGEVVFMGLLPWALFLAASYKLQATSYELQGAGRSTKGAGRQVAAWLGLAMIVILLFFTLPGLALWATALLLVWALWPAGRWAGRLASAIAVLVGAVAGVGLLWMLHGGPGVDGVTASDVAAHAVYPYQLVSAAWGYGISTPEWRDALPLQLGLVAVGLSMLTAVMLATRNPQLASRESQLASRRSHPTIVFALIATLVLVVLSSTVARPLWTGLPFVARTLSYPWQLYALVGAPLALLAGSVVVLDWRLAILPAWAGLITLAVLGSYPYLSPRFTRVVPDPATLATFGSGQVTLLTAAVEGPVSMPGYPLDEAVSTTGADIDSSHVMTVTVNWQGLRPLDFDYNVFVHAVDEDGAILAQSDRQPGRNGDAYPMTTWPVGEIVLDSYRLILDRDAAARVRSVNLGLYNWQTGERLPMGEDNRAVLEVGP